MSNEPKWRIHWENDGEVYATKEGIQEKYYSMRIEDELNRLESEVERLQKAYDQLTGEKFSDRVHAALKSRAEESESEVERLKEDRNDLENIIISGHAGRLNKRLTEINERLQSELARCKSERLGVEGFGSVEAGNNSEHLMDAERYTAFRASQQTQEGKG